VRWPPLLKTTTVGRPCVCGTLLQIAVTVDVPGLLSLVSSEAATCICMLTDTHVHMYGPPCACVHEHLKMGMHITCSNMGIYVCAYLCRYIPTYPHLCAHIHAHRWLSPTPSPASRLVSVWGGGPSVSPETPPQWRGRTLIARQVGGGVRCVDSTVLSLGGWEVRSSPPLHSAAVPCPVSPAPIRSGRRGRRRRRRGRPPPSSSLPPRRPLRRPLPLPRTPEGPA